MTTTNTIGVIGAGTSEVAGAADILVVPDLEAGNMLAKHLAGERIEAVLARAPGDGNTIGGLKVVTKNGWFSARPSGTEDVYKIYTESFIGEEHLKRIQAEARALVADALAR